ncbi:thioredoxin-like protein 4A [Colletotrichum cuscutae]|uniref:Thioredoxin-like protein 4A n=1 Tax=Colletotrichum cuscutae TaxID=1209917 RepID=A0AAJ0DMP1_9PEZI|nr:thioredoxin-like protein 4A [Colletotrichum cuscutae]
MGSIVIPHLNSGWHVDQAILSEEERLVVIRFGRDADRDCMKQDEVLYRISDRVKNFASIYVCDIDQVPDFNQSTSCLLSHQLHHYLEKRTPTYGNTHNNSLERLGANIRLPGSVRTLRPLHNHVLLPE